MPFSNITPQEACQRMQEGFAYLDVRTAEEFQKGHAKGAVNIPIFIATPSGREFNPNFLRLVQERFPDKKTQLVIGCHSGGRSAKACELLCESGYDLACNIVGGFGGGIDPETGDTVKGWKDAGLPWE